MTETYEARGPHLPDVMTRQSLWVYLFLAAAFVQVGVVWWDWAGRGALADAGAFLSIVGLRLENVISSLFGAALFVRHPDSRKRLPLIAFGLGLIAALPLIRLFDEPIATFLDSLAPTEVPALSPGVITYHVLLSLLGTAAVLYLGAGLSDARRRGAQRAEQLALVLLALISIAAVAVTVTPIGGVAAPSTPFEWVLVGFQLAISLLYGLAWAYVIAVVFGGWIAREEPRLGWSLALASVGLGLAIRVISSLFIVTAAVTRSIPTSLFSVLGAAQILASVLLLAAFAVGLPATEPTVDQPAATPPGSEAG